MREVRTDRSRRPHFRAGSISILLVVYLLVARASVRAQPPSSSDCAGCHGGDEEGYSVVTVEMIAGSAHDGLECLDCHAGIEETPHADSLPPVDCGACHGDVAEIYTKHGRGVVGTTEDIPTCADCHGSHEIRGAATQSSAVHPMNLPETCGRCHENIDLAKKHDIQLKKPIESYQASIHGRATAGGVPLAASCNDCHSSNGSAHRILGPGDPESAINRFQIPSTCGKCHGNIEEDYWSGIHGQLTARGESDSPVCTHCHGEHGILPVDDPRARVSPVHVAEATCTPCHEAAFLNEKYGIPAGRLASFVDSYHGLKSRAGDTRVANCTSCHGGHKILPSTNPHSSIYPENLQNTCGHCHPGISAELASVKVHESRAGMSRGWPGVIAFLYTLIIVGTIGGMVFYCWIDFRRQYKRIMSVPQIQRMDANAIWQHSILMVSFTVLVITGFALRFHDGWLINRIFAWDGGSEVRGIIHRAAAALFTFGCVWHLLFLRSHSGREFWRGMLPRRGDFSQLVGMLRYNLGKSDARPRFDRFSYIEKVEYWALIWGSVVMGVTGFLLWFDNYAVQIVPKGFLNVMLVVHYYEAVLATLAIAVWHLYSTVFSPAVYPGNPAWLTGSMPRAMYEHERAIEPADSPPSESPAPPASEPEKLEKDVDGGKYVS
ncbi:MAG: cytochrome c3 family protein [bacterium]